MYNTWLTVLARDSRPIPKSIVTGRFQAAYNIVIMQYDILKRHNQAKIINKSVILFWLFSMTI